jgi:hypothetical protein
MFTLHTQQVWIADAPCHALENCKGFLAKLLQHADKVKGLQSLFPFTIFWCCPFVYSIPSNTLHPFDASGYRYRQKIHHEAQEMKRFWTRIGTDLQDEERKNAFRPV